LWTFLLGLSNLFVYLNSVQRGWTPDLVLLGYGEDMSPPLSMAIQATLYAIVCKEMHKATLQNERATLSIDIVHTGQNFFCMEMFDSQEWSNIYCNFKTEEELGKKPGADGMWGNDFTSTHDTVLPILLQIGLRMVYTPLLGMTIHSTLFDVILSIFHNQIIPLFTYTSQMTSAVWYRRVHMHCALADFFSSCGDTVVYLFDLVICLVDL
jgi:hypothetical protein